MRHLATFVAPALLGLDVTGKTFSLVPSAFRAAEGRADVLVAAEGGLIGRDEFVASRIFQHVAQGSGCQAAFNQD